jgi:hypothetical protein
MITSNIPAILSVVGRRVRLTSPPSVAVPVGASISHSPIGLHGLLQRQISYICQSMHTDRLWTAARDAIPPSAPLYVFLCRRIKL